MKTDPYIEVTPEQGKLIAEIICHEIKESRGKNAKRYKLCKRCENQYNQVTKYEAAGKKVSFPWDNAADYFVPMTEWIVDAVVARVDGVLFQEEPYMTAYPVEGMDVDNSEAVTDFVDMVLREIVKIRKDARFMFKQMVKLPFAVAKYDWVSEYEPMIMKEEAMAFVGRDGGEQFLLQDDPEAMIKQAQMTIAGFQPQGTKEVWVMQEREVKNRPEFRYINSEDYVYSPYAKRDHKLYWEGDRFWMTPNDMKLQVMQEKFRQEAVTKIMTDLGIEEKLTKDKALAERQLLRECYHWYGRLPFNQNNEIDFEGKDTIEQEIYAIVDYKGVETLCIKHWVHRRIPYPDRVYIRGEFEETTGWEGRSLVQKLYSTQKYLNDIYNTIMNNAYLAMMKIFTKKSTLQGPAWDKVKIYPGKFLEVMQADDVNVLEVGDVKAIGWEIEQSLLNFAARISNIDIYQTGTSRQQGQKTLGEVEATLKEGNIGLDRFLANCHDILRKVSQWTVDYYYDNMPPGLERRIRGDRAMPIFPTRENQGMYQEQGVAPYWEKDNLAGRYDFIWRGTSINDTKQYKIMVANDLMDRYMQVPMVGMNLLAVRDILKRGLIARGIKDYDRILPPEQALMMEMERIQAEADAKKKIPSKEARAAKKVEEQGATREEAVRSVQERVRGGKT